MKNLHILPTDKPSILGRFIDTNNLFLRVSNDIPRGENVNIYITSDEEIKDGDVVKIPCGVGKVKELTWKFGNDNPSYIVEDIFIYKLRYGQKEGELQINSFRYEDVKKIILTTDQNLINDGVQAIDDEFLEWFVKNPSCEEVKISLEETQYGSGIYEYVIYKKEIPKEEPKQDNIQQFQEGIKSLDNNFKEQENTLEEIVIKNFNEEYIKIDLYDSNDNFIGKLDRNQYIDVRIQAYMKNIKGLYVVYPDGEKGFINHENGAVSYFQEGLWDTALRLSRLLMSLQSNDIKNQNRIIE